MKIKKIIPLAAFAAISLASAAQTPQAKQRSGIDLANMDNSVRPQDNFYQYACGGWIKKNPLPAAYSRYGSFDVLGEDNQKRINGILKELLEKDYPQGSTEKKLSDLYKLAMDEQRRNKDGVSPLMPVIQELEKAKTVKQLFDVQLGLVPYGDSEFFGLYIASDQKNASQNILNVVQSGITLGQKEYYLDNDSATVAIREAYKKHIVRMFQMFGFSSAASEAKMRNVLKIETELASVSKSNAQLRDAEANYNKMTFSQFESKYPNVHLGKLLEASGVKLSDAKELVVGQVEFMNGVNTLLSRITPSEYRDYMEWGQIMSAASYLSDDVVAANFDFFGKTMSGSKENHPLWKRATMQVEGQMGQALGKIYVEKYFPASSKERMKTLVENLQNALAKRIEAQDWMSAETKKNALDKLATFYVKIGYPDKWIDMSDLNIDPAKSYYANIEECRRFWNKWTVDTKSGKPVDKDEWQMFPQTVNAYYNPTTNEICFPAGILQVPFFDATADDAFNYGAIGVVIGHEMTHGFDDQGRHYDKDGNMKDWWTKQDAESFSKKSELYKNFFASIKVLPDLNANGELTLGENLADHGGLQVAFEAYKEATKDHPLPVVDGLTPDQRFFIAYAQLWAANITEAEIRNRTKSDPHSLGKWRVDGALPHISMWYDAFGVKPTDKMFVPADKRLVIW